MARRTRRLPPVPTEVPRTNANKGRRERYTARKERKAALERQNRRGRIRRIPITALPRDESVASEQTHSSEQTSELEQKLEDESAASEQKYSLELLGVEQKLEDEQSVDTKPRIKRERNSIPERTMAPNHPVMPQPTITAATSDVHIITGWVIEDLDGDRLLVQCAAGGVDLVHPNQPVIYVIKRNPSAIANNQDRVMASGPEGQG